MWVGAFSIHPPPSQEDERWLVGGRGAAE